MKILKVDAFSAIVAATDMNDIQAANEMLKIVSNSILKDKKIKTFSPYIELKTKKEFNLFKRVLSTLDIQINEDL